jgi:mannose-6-phosphate isomerase-like protein (cupin superfamily)
VPFTEKALPRRIDATAPDGSTVRLLSGCARGGLAHFELAAGDVSTAVKHHSVDELWYVLSGTGRMWRRHMGEEREIDLRPGISLSIPVGTAFQFRNCGQDPLTIIGVTMPPWPGPTKL